jgi:hypothetical protein
MGAVPVLAVPVLADRLEELAEVVDLTSGRRVVELAGDPAQERAELALADAGVAHGGDLGQLREARLRLRPRARLLPRLAAPSTYSFMALSWSFSERPTHVSAFVELTLPDRIALCTSSHSSRSFRRRRTVWTPFAGSSGFPKRHTRAASSSV